MKLKKAVGLRIRDTRTRVGLTQQKLSDEIERSVETIRSIERGATAPGFETLERLSKTFGVPVRDFFDFGGADASINSRRLQLMGTLLDAVPQLDDDGLELAVKMLETLVQQRSASNHESDS